MKRLLSLLLVLSAVITNLLAQPQLPQVLRQAQAGDVRAQYMAGMMYMLGKGARQNLPEAVRWLSTSARAGSPQAMLAMASLYDVGQGVPFDSARALELRQRAASMGEPVAQGQLADDRRLPGQADFRRASVLYDLGMYAQSIPYAQRAAQAGSANANLLLGRAYHFGLGAPVNLPLAVRYYRASADRGLADGARHLAYMYEFGYGIAPSKQAALHYYDMAAAKGDAQARQAAANLRSSDYDARPRSGGGGGGGFSVRPHCRGDYEFDLASGTCRSLVPGLNPYIP
ncbi:MAG TPA: tetratricopeptide repeat protein [Edaphobacter sp.]